MTTFQDCCQSREMQLVYIFIFLQIYLANLSGKLDVEKIIFENNFFSLIINETIEKHRVPLSHQIRCAE